MRINTKFFGEMDIDAEGIFTFQNGIPGFNDLHKFVVLKEENSVFDYLQSVERESVCFVLVNPFTVVTDYDIEISEASMKKLDIESEEDVILYSILTIGSDAKDITVNLKAPILLSLKNKKGVQEILDDDRYNTKHRLVKETDK